MRHAYFNADPEAYPDSDTGPEKPHGNAHAGQGYPYHNGHANARDMDAYTDTEQDPHRDANAVRQYANCDAHADARDLDARPNTDPNAPVRYADFDGHAGDPDSNEDCRGADRNAYRSLRDADTDGNGGIREPDGYPDTGGYYPHGNGGESHGNAHCDLSDLYVDPNAAPGDADDNFYARNANGNHDATDGDADIDANSDVRGHHSYPDSTHGDAHCDGNIPGGDADRDWNAEDADADNDGHTRDADGNADGHRDRSAPSGVYSHRDGNTGDSDLYGDEHARRTWGNPDGHAGDADGDAHQRRRRRWWANPDVGAAAVHADSADGDTAFGPHAHNPGRGGDADDHHGSPRAAGGAGRASGDGDSTHHTPTSRQGGVGPDAGRWGVVPDGRSSPVGLARHTGSGFVGGRAHVAAAVAVSQDGHAVGDRRAGATAALARPRW